ncbi:unnamed protein product [Nesidiocoris tenuis]|uniref:Uncharacterized protein n=1 Tax=Nesidiocoris tenuis TaxID=355587 RepID=A0A6H5G2J5_9HEMI|nr:unnamed protein product [Nesidiocoris tenuis]
MAKNRGGWVSYKYRKCEVKRRFQEHRFIFHFQPEIQTTTQPDTLAQTELRRIVNPAFNSSLCNTLRIIHPTSLEERRNSGVGNQYSYENRSILMIMNPYITFVHARIGLLITITANKSNTRTLSKAEKRNCFRQHRSFRKPF